MFFKSKTGSEKLSVLENCRGTLDFIGTIGNCCALRSRAESKAASQVVSWLGLPSHHDSQKNWDTLKSLYYILKTDDSGKPILDAGASSNSAILKWLSILGFKDLHACDIRQKDPEKYAQRNIKFSVQDLTQSNYPDNFFQAVTAISVIEHGVPLEKFVAEMFRILMPGGFLLISTDYWSDPVDCTGIFPYGREMGEMKIFLPRELEDFCRIAADAGFSLCSPLDLSTAERAVRWDRVDREYTFAFIALRKYKPEHNHEA